jgi:serine/threonine protein phosphatase PrpC
MTDLPVKVTSYAATDVGRRRKHNEDAYLCDDELGLWVVADGMGGQAAGEVASQQAVETVHEMVLRGLRAKGSSPEINHTRVLESAVQAATYMVFGMAELDREKAGMGTTISAMLVSPRGTVLAQVGDSRIYRIRSGKAEQLTEDHTLVNWQIRQGLITQEEARQSRQRNVITRAVGNREYVQVDLIETDVALGDQFLLCSDGLHGYLEPDELPDRVREGGDAAVRALVDLANDRGGKDNITAVLVEVT